ncbi:MAG: sensor histidine kinase [Anaerolineae bacterium]
MALPNSAPAERADEAGLVQDLQSTFLFATLLILFLGTLILASGNNVIALQIPAGPLTAVVFVALAITLGGQIALRHGVQPRPIAWSVMGAYTLLISLTVHFTGGPLTPVPALYLLAVVGTAFLLGHVGATVIATLSVIAYAIILYLEYVGLLPMIQIWRSDFSPEGRGWLFVVNWVTLTIPTMVTSQLAGTLAQRLRSTNLQLRESEHLRETLTNMVVHDLRNPITALMGVLDILRMGQNSLSPELQRLLQDARHSGETLLRLVDELLDISKMEAGKLEPSFETVKIEDLLTREANAVRVLTEIEGQNLDVEIAEEVGLVQCDPNLIGRVIANLLSNAIKYTPPEGAIRLRAHGNEEEIVISVEDTGPGIPPEYQATIFDKFTQVKEQQPERRGTGLGLTFCKMAVEAHGGRIWVESQVGEGSTFSFTLPLVPGQHA